MAKKQPAPAIAAPRRPIIQLSSRGWLAGILATIAALLYINTLRSDYALDDVTVITNNSIVAEGISAVPRIFATPYLHGVMHNPNDLYRPLPLATFAVELELFGNNPAAAHFLNVLLFCCCVVALFYFLDALFGRERTRLAFLSALLFALHPIHTEVVANIKSRDELLCFLFAFTALHFWLRFARHGRMASLFSAGALYFLSLLSKETSYSFVLLAPLLFGLWEGSNRRRTMLISLCAIAVAGLALGIRFLVLNAYDANHPFAIPITENSLAGAQSLGVRLATAILTLGMYLKLLIAPYPLRCDYSYNTIPLTSFADWRVLLSCLLYIGMAVAGGWLLWRKRRNVYALSALFFLVPLALFANIFFLVGATMAERFLFFPSVGFCLAGAHLLLMANKGTDAFFSKKLYIILVPLALIWGFLAIQRNAEWRDDLTLFHADQPRTPNSYRLSYYLASATINAANEAGEGTPQRAELLREAMGYLRQSIAIYPRFSVTHSQAGITYTNLGQFDSAEYHSHAALALNNRDTFTRNNLAAVYFKQGRYQPAIALCRQNLAQYPRYARAYTNMGACYLKLGRPDSAAAALQQVLVLEPDNQTAAYFLSVAKGMMAQVDSAR